MQSGSSVTFSTAVREDLQALINHLHSQAGGYDPSAGISLDGMFDFIRTQQALGASGVVEVPPGAFGGPTEITPVHNVLDRLQFIQGNQAYYTTGIAELAVSHSLSQPVDVDFNDRHFRERNLDRLPEPFGSLVRAIQVAIDAHLIAAIPNPLRPNTLVLVVLLGRDNRWSEQHEQALYRTLEPATGIKWTAARRPLK